MPQKKLKCITIDDEENAHFVLKHFISKLDYVVHEHSFLNAIDAFNYLREHTIDLIFLDINMPEVDGFTFLKMLTNKPMVIITTAYTDHAYKGFEHNAIDYLHKPIRFERFLSAVDKAIKWQEINNKENELPEFLQIKAEDHVQQIPIADILYIESLGNYAKVHLNNKSLITFSTTKDLEEKLAGTSCIRIHKSYIVNVDKVDEVNNDRLLVNKQELPIGKTYKKHFEYLWQTNKQK